MTEESTPSPRPEATWPGVPSPPAGGGTMTSAPPPAAPAPPAGPAPAGYGPPTGGPGHGPHAVPGGAGFTSRYGLVRPAEGRYLAGVCAAVGRATNTDPVLWRVLLAVLGFFGGVGILVYVSVWLTVPGEGDSASPIESMLGRGRSSMSPLTVIVLTILVAVSFGFIVTDAFRAVLLGVAILIGGALLLNRDRPPATGGPWPPVPPGATPHHPTGTGPAGQPDTVPPAAFPGPTVPSGPVGVPTPPGYRPPFAPHGPYAGAAPPPPPPSGQVPKPPRERSALGAATFSLVFLACGLLAVLDLIGVVGVGASAYFAVALATIGLGLLVGAWFGRARWLIALGLVTSAALGFATAAESFADWRSVNGHVVWTPTSYDEIAPRYENTFGDARLDLRQVDFDQRDSRVAVVVTFGDLTVLLPPEVDVTTSAEIHAGDATIFGTRSGEPDRQVRQVTDLGVDGPGGGTLHLLIQVNVGVLQVTR